MPEILLQKNPSRLLFLCFNQKLLCTKPIDNDSMSALSRQLSITLADLTTEKNEKNVRAKLNLFGGLSTLDFSTRPKRGIPTTEVNKQLVWAFSWYLPAREPSESAKLVMNQNYKRLCALWFAPHFKGNTWSMHFVYHKGETIRIFLFCFDSKYWIIDAGVDLSRTISKITLALPE